MKRSLILLSVIFLMIMLFSCKPEMETVSTPTFNPPSGEYKLVASVVISTITEGAEIRYTTDGSDPSETLGTLYSNAITIFQNTTLKAIAYKTGWNNSDIAIDDCIIDSSVSVPSGTFTQSDGTNSFEHTISAFQMYKYETTYELWYAVYQWAISNGYTFANSGREGNDGTIGAAPTAAKYEPVTMVSWRDVIVWCNAYSEIMGYTPCYTYEGSVIKDSRDSNATACDGAVCNWSANGYRLPTEGEWQYAASYKDGTSWTPYNYASGATAPYTDSAATDIVAWYDDNSGDSTHDVGTKNPNALDIYDMSGNIWEWCWDWYETYPTDAQTDYRGATTSSFRSLRGGGWTGDISLLQVGARDFSLPHSEYYNIGFRLARSGS